MRTRCLAAIVIGAAAATLVAAGQAPTLDFSDPQSWSGPSPGVTRDSNTQLMMIDLLDFDVPAVAAPAPVTAMFPRAIASVWQQLVGSPPRLDTESRGIWLYPAARRTRGVLQGVTRPTRVHAYLTSLGTSTGEAFDVQVINDGPTPVHIGGDGVVVEPIKKGADNAVRAELQKAVATRGQTIATSKANAYCLEFKLNPPDKGTMFHVVDAPTQQKFGAARAILHASRALQASRELQPDSDPTDYFHAIRQWAIWVNEQHFTVAQYRAAFIARTEKNLAAVGAKWNKQIEDTLNGFVPHRWDEIVKILRAAGQPVPGT